MGPQSVVARRFFSCSNPSCTPRIGLQADAVQRARRMRLESAASPTTLPSEVTKGLLQSPRGEGGRGEESRTQPVLRKPAATPLIEI